ncbi:hypothetical protein [Dyadobacter sp. 676]|uniref:Secreted protein n=1 Tax=Dyadobacter sp. 676 TaxID=3088362 RepID=A0AAU8FKJ2_9BACT
MRNFYVYLTGIVLLASGAEIVSKISDDAAAPQVKWLAKKENPSDRKKQERVPFARTQKKRVRRHFSHPVSVLPIPTRSPIIPVLPVRLPVTNWNTPW